MKYKYNGIVYDVSIKALDSMPIGSIILFAGEEDSIPTGWMICDGRVVAREGLEELYDVIGAIYGTPPSNSEFYLPDLRGKVPVGVDANDTDFNLIGETGGSKYLQAHEHNVRGVDSNTYEAMFISNAATNAMTGAGSGYGLKVSYAKAVSTGAGDSGNLQPYLTLNYIIKAYNTTPTMASIVDDYSTSTQDGYSCNYVNDNLGEVVWVNNRGNPFGSTNSSVSFGDYKKFKVYYYLDNHYTNLISRTCNLGDTLNISESSGALTRQIDISSNTLYIHSGYYQGGQNNDAIIPSHIIGYK